MPQTTDTIASHLDRINWNYRVVGPTTVMTSYRCLVDAYYYAVAIEIRLTQHWVIVRALLQRDVGSAQVDSVLRLISEWNLTVYRARFLMVGGCVVLQSEVPAAQLTIDSFLEALYAVCRYSALAGVEIATLATNPSLRDTFDAALAANRAPFWDEALPPPDFGLDFDISVNRLPE